MIKKTSYPLKTLILISLLTLAGCSQQFLFPGQSPNEKLEISVAAADRPGVYKLAGNSNLPDQSRIVVAAVRYLRPAAQPPLSNPNLTYSILAYQDAVVTGGKWQTTLNLWQVAPDGQFREAWQLKEQAELGLSLAPLTEISFVATLAPSGQLPELAKQLEQQVMALSNSFIKYTTDGQRYAQVSQILPVALPTGRTTPPQQRPEDFNYGWGDRYIIRPESPSQIQLEAPREHRSSAPLSATEFLR